MIEEKIGIIHHFFSNVQVAAIKIIKGSLSIGDTIHIVGTHTDFTQQVKSIQINQKSVETVSEGDDVGILVENRVRENDIIYKV